MRLNCPFCSHHYDLADELIGGGRGLRCAQCRESWHADPSLALAVVEDAITLLAKAVPAAAAGAALAAADPPEPTRDIVTEVRSERFPPRPRRAAARRRPAARRLAQPRPRGAAMALLVLLLPCAGMAAVAQKEALVRALPASAGLFETIGLPVNLRGLALEDFHGSMAALPSGPVLTLQGRISNLRALPTIVPAIRIAVRDKTHRELYSWTTPVQKSKLEPGESLPVHSRLAAPPDGAAEIIVSFAEAGSDGMAPAQPAERATSADPVAGLTFRTATP